MARFLFVTADADPNIRRRARSGIICGRRSKKFGPNKWEPYAAPEQYRGKNVILVFYLGVECPPVSSTAPEKTFEEMELHSTILIDKRGRVIWARTGGAPFGDMAFLTKELERSNQRAN